MNSALRIVAFSNCSRREGILALLETALGAMTEDGDVIAAAYLDFAAAQFILGREDSADLRFEGLGVCG